MKLFDKFKKWKLGIQLNGLHIGKFHIIKHKRYHSLTNQACVCYGVIQDKTDQIKKLENEIKIYKQLLDSSQQVNRNYGNNR